jgi:hypothetical protein
MKRSELKNLIKELVEQSLNESDHETVNGTITFEVPNDEYEYKYSAAVDINVTTDHNSHPYGDSSSTEYTSNTDLGDVDILSISPNNSHTPDLGSLDDKLIDQIENKVKMDARNQIQQ